ncbi:MAG TPA: hypothetical protein VFX49_19565 [Chloroflexota bacterium]|nr:hypothetical protein [Chloroflexota bacterium]
MDERSAAREIDALPGDDYPLRRHAERAIGAAATPPPGWKPLGYTARDYVTLLRGICGYFQAFQDERGAILDPYAADEKQYATPCYAVAAALTALDGHPGTGVWGRARRAPDEAPADAALLESAARAEDHALRSLAVDKNTPQNHADFFAPLVVLGYQLLAPFVERARAARWRSELRSIDPEATYRNTFSYKRERGQEQTVHNWNVVAVAGELLREVAGAGADRAWVDRYLDYQLSAHADLVWGLYRDPNCPLPYDLFPRHHLAYALAAVGNERVDTRLPEWLARGEWTSALTQTGSGGIPPGWRSSEHLWNDAALVALAETAACRHADAGRALTAGIFRRVAALAFRSMLHWRRPSGELHVVKNHFDPAQRWGFEAYSFHSNYGLYSAAMLATAILFGDCETAEAPAPVETGSHAIRYPEPFHTLVATHRGLTLSFDLDADGKYDVTGLNSIRRVGAHPLLGPASGIPAAPRYSVPAPPGSAVGVGLAWEGGSLAAAHPGQVEVMVADQDASRLSLELRYALGAGTVHERYVLADGAIDASATLTTEDVTATMRWPFLVSDGLGRGSGRVVGGALEWSLGDSRQRLRLDGVRLTDSRVQGRNGEYVLAEAPAQGGRASWRLEYE